MSQPSPWSIKGIGPDARRLAKKAAQKEGMTLGAWLSQKIAEASESGDAPAPAAAAPARRTAAAPAPRPEDAAAAPSGEMMALMRELTELMRAERDRPAAPAQPPAVAAPDPRLEQITRSLEGLADARLETARRLDALDDTTRRIDEALLETVEAIDANRRQTATAVRAAALLADRVALLDPELGDGAAPAERRLAPQTALDALAERLNRRCAETEAALAALDARLEQAMSDAPEYYESAETLADPGAATGFEEAYRETASHYASWAGEADAVGHEREEEPEEGAGSDLENGLRSGLGADQPYAREGGGAVGADAPYDHGAAEEPPYGPIETAPETLARDDRESDPLSDPWPETLKPVDPAAFPAGETLGEPADPIAPGDEPVAAGVPESERLAEEAWAEEAFGDDPEIGDPGNGDPWTRAFGGAEPPATGEAEFLPEATPQVEIKPLGVAALRDRLRADLEREETGELSLAASLQKIRNLLPKSQRAPASSAATAAGLAQEIRALDELLKSEKSAGETGDGARSGSGDDLDEGLGDDLEDPLDMGDQDARDDRLEARPADPHATRERAGDDNRPQSLTESLTRAIAAERGQDAEPESDDLEERLAWLVGRTLSSVEDADAEPTRHSLPSWLRRRAAPDDRPREEPTLELDDDSRLPPEEADGEEEAAQGGFAAVYDDEDDDQPGGASDPTRFDRLDRSSFADALSARPWRGAGDAAEDGSWAPGWRGSDRDARLAAAGRYWVETAGADGAAAESGGPFSGALPLALFSATIGAAIILAYGSAL